MCIAFILTRILIFYVLPIFFLVPSNNIAVIVVAVRNLKNFKARFYSSYSSWDASPTLKEDHKLIKHGPYAIVRHPIYTGLLLACLGAGLAAGEVRGFLWILCIPGFVQKALVEEDIMHKAFKDYRNYASRVSRFIPWLC